ncbi:MAG: hypothetical protein F7C34_03145 [Desulfurococcales archaeon]|nr:hypothetical protein [Desulfurococcales archaeon]
MRLSEETFARLLSSFQAAGADVSKPHISGDCYEMIGEFEGHPFAVYIFRGIFSDGIIVKVEKRVRSCFEALYGPTGLYAITRDGSIEPDRLARKIRIVLYAQEHQL